MAKKTASADTAFSEALENARDQQGRSLADLSRSTPILVIFLRHLG